MTSPAKSRSRGIAGVEPRLGPFVNDNRPPAFPGHELSGLDGLQRPPAAEVVIHYARVAHIASYPVHPDLAREPASVPVMDALPENTEGRRPPSKQRAAIAGFCSLLFHAAVFTALMTAAVSPPEDPVEEAGDTVSVVMLGDSDADQLASGTKSEEPQPQPDAVVAEAVQPTTTETAETEPVEPQPSETPPIDAVQPVQPTEVQPAQPLPEAVQPAQVQPTQTVTQVSPETVMSPEPEVLASQVPAEPTVAQPMATEIQPEEMKPAEAPPSETPPTDVPADTVQPAEVVPPAETVVATSPTPPEETVTPIEKPTPPKPVQKPKEVVKKQPPMPAKVKSGSEGENERNSTRGSSEGTEAAQSDRSSLSANGRQGSGSAAVANYPGKVQAAIGRSVRRSAGRVAAGTTVRVRLTIGASGQLASLSLAHSSGIADFDTAVMDGVRRAAPFPPLPPEWGKPSWSFTQEVQAPGN